MMHNENSERLTKAAIVDSEHPYHAKCHHKHLTLFKLLKYKKYCKTYMIL